MQLVLTLLIVMLCAAYAGWRIYKALSAPQNACAGCDGCALKDRCKANYPEKQACEKKK